MRKRPGAWMDGVNQQPGEAHRPGPVSTDGDRDRRRPRVEAPPDDISARFGEPSRTKLLELVAFAQTYRKWSHRDLAAFLGRDVHNLIPGSGIPKADLICRLAKALDWPAHAVFDEVCGERRAPTEDPHRGVDDYRELNRAAYAAFADGRFEEMIGLALRMQSIARSPEQRAEGCLREWGGWDGMGRYEQALEVVQRGLRESEAPAPLRCRLRANLASTYCALGQYVEAEGVATIVLDRARLFTMDSDPWQGIGATALHVRGIARRAQALAESDDRMIVAAQSRADLTTAEETWRTYADRVGVAAYSAAAHTCRGALITLDALVGVTSSRAALSQVLDELDHAADVGRLPKGWIIESYGWWCVFGAEVALHAEDLGPERDQLLAILTNKGHEIADMSGHWALRERMLTIEYLRQTRAKGLHVTPDESTLDTDDLQLIAGAMARFPRFRPFGWELVRRAPKIH